ncbi:MAG TPA: hypothetical protein VG389_22875, partial [Myxococcota bacterium]|nr:hypothetical protein [Myxococcota bacterium]
MALDAEQLTALVGGVADQVKAGETLAGAGRLEKVEVKDDGTVTVFLTCVDYAREQRFAVEDLIVEKLEAAGVE